MLFDEKKTFKGESSPKSPLNGIFYRCTGEISIKLIRLSKVYSVGGKVTGFFILLDNQKFSQGKKEYICMKSCV